MSGSNGDFHTKNEIKKLSHNQKRVKHMTTVQSWETGLGVRIPSQFAKDLSIQNGSQIELELLERGLIMRPTINKPTLDDLLAQTKGKPNPHLDYDFGLPKGKEFN
ncbi:AbrB/MazE/SpoVT family DNA-binding domain-containing protein [Metabacillus sp. 84]|uniref:AbrB/MazE/SpoVT family DNA-binding domain-containing protein n=1 Tax=unclassified Metabacillus TaxID=2675274 RepID=UPI003CF026CB